MKQIQVNDELHDKIKVTAEKEDRTMVKVIERAVDSYVDSVNVPTEQN